ncbi:MAG TPA: hypothetical protein VEC36_03010 [Patescibacteria group bacterium]|nr:hypothetical protein [Patescibacteria group bacterium]
MSDKLYDLKVTDKNSFIEFLELLHEDFKSNKASWENPDLESFLEAMIRYTEDIQGYYDNIKPQENIDAEIPTWSQFADILRGAIVYE